jgi:hypothetical protein
MKTTLPSGQVLGSASAELSERTQIEMLRATMQLLLDQVDYTKGACNIVEPVGGCLPHDVIETCHRTLLLTKPEARP